MKLSQMFSAKSTSPHNITLKERLVALRNIPALFKLVWQTSKWMTICTFALRIAKSVLPLSILYVSKLIIDQIVLLNRAKGSLPHDYLIKLVLIQFSLAIVSDILGRAIALVDALLGDLFSNHTSIRIMEHAATLDLDQFEDSVFYDKLERARQQTAGRTVLLTQVMTQIQDFITIGALAVGLLTFNFWLIALLLITIIPSFLGEAYFNDRTYALTRNQTPQRRELDYLRYLGASDDTAKEVKIFDLSGFIIDRFRTLSTKFYHENSLLAIKRSAWGSLFSFIATAGYYVAYIIIAFKAATGQTTIGQLMFMVGSFSQVRSLMEGILSRFTAVSQGAIYLRDFFDFFEIKPKIPVPKNPRPFPNPIVQGYTFEDVGFKYLNSERWANRHLNFTLHPGEKLALVGENGAGKTTLVKLLSRLYDPTEGRILLDGHDLKEYDITELRMQTGIIFQDFLRYQFTFGQNIAVGNIKKVHDQALIERAAQLSMADALAAKLPGQYEQVLGRRFNQGIELSGGEWQKIALARAYMRNAALLILDEPTAALDARAEFEVFQRFAKLTADKTAVLISHRFSTVRMADRILVLEKGELVEMGSHQELLEQGGRYAELFNLQAAGYR